MECVEDYHAYHRRMRISRSLVTSTWPLILCGLLAACGGSGADVEDSARSSPASAGEASTGASASEATRTLTADEMQAYERGLRREIEAVKAAHARTASAATAAERGEAAQAAWETSTIPLGAAASGLPAGRYEQVRETVEEIFRTLDFQGKVDGPLSIDLERVDETTKARLARDPFDDLTPDSARTLRAHMDRLLPVWMEYVRLTAVAG
jgi:hypothetical protein